MTAPWPARIEDEGELEDLLTRPSPKLVDFVRTLPSPLLVLGAGGKMGPTLCALAKRAADAANHPLEVIAASRFRDGVAREWLEARGVKTEACDLLKPGPIRELPDAANIVYLVGLKFGTSQNPSATWAVNTIVPARVAERFPGARIAALSTGNVYPLGEAARGGSVESDATTPLGEYANAAVARERVFEYCAGEAGTKIALLRLFYAVETRYGVLVDLAQKVFRGEPVELANGWFNCVWQGDANEMILRSLALASNPPRPWNLCLPEVFSVRAVAARLGEILGKAPRFSGAETATALLGNSAKLCAELGPPSVGIEPMLGWVAHWVAQGGRNLGRPTHFEVRDGNY